MCNDQRSHDVAVQMTVLVDEEHVLNSTDRFP